MPTLTENDVRRLLDPAQVIAAIESGFRDRYPSIVLPPRTHINLSEGIFLIMPCYDPAGSALGMKLVVVQAHPRNPGDRIQATYLLLDPATGAPRMIAPANYLTDLRTAATSAVATKFLARKDVKTLGVFGTGRQARAHLLALPRVRNFKRILVCGTTPSRSRTFAQAMSQEFSRPVEPADAAVCAAESDVICACTNSQLPLFDGNLLRSGAHLNLVGSFQPHVREVDTATIRRSRVVVETCDAVMSEAGDLLIPIHEGAITREHVLADLHALLNGKKKVRTSPDDITLFKSVGCALEDLVTAELLAKHLAAAHFKIL